MLRENRDELHTGALTPEEQKDRAVRQDICERTKMIGATPQQECRGWQELKGQFDHYRSQVKGYRIPNLPTKEQQAEDTQNNDEAWRVHARMRNHAAHCPQCNVFPQAVPYLKDFEA